jgi:hypothetical protein
MRIVIPFCVTALSVLIACSTTPYEIIDPGAVSAQVRERITLEQAKEELFGWLEKRIQKTEARLAEESQPEKRVALTEESRSLKSLLDRLHRRHDPKLFGFNPETDQLWTYERFADETNKRGGETGVVLIQKGKITYLYNFVRD